MNRLKNGTVIEAGDVWGVIIGTCSYDNNGPDNAYVVRYVWGEKAWEPRRPRRPYAIIEMKNVSLVDAEEFPEDFYIGGPWSSTPEDRCDEWERVTDPETGNVLIVPLLKAK